MRSAKFNNGHYADITRTIIEECEGTVDDFAVVGTSCAVGALRHRLICATSTMSDAATDLTVHLSEDLARIVVFRGWIPDSALVGTVGYGRDFGDNLRALIQHVEQRLRMIPDSQIAIESLVAE